MHNSSESTLRPVTARRSNVEVAAGYPIIAYSHLGWDWVWQRPQQFLSRLSRNHRVLFIESPAPADSLNDTRVVLREAVACPNITVLQMQMPAEWFYKIAKIDAERVRAVESVLAGPLGALFESPVHWFYDPMAIASMPAHLGARAVVYDCMDELSLFRAAPAELVQRERQLLMRADVVFAGGPKIWRAKRQLQPNCFCFGCGVDAAHFGRAQSSRLPVPQDVANLPRPRFGYIGVVDERIDYALVDQLAASTGGSVLMLGPVAKVDPNTFPCRPNLHWLGGRDYAELPDYARAFDVCLMPFALNDATKFINPTKALEYMATARPIVSTAVEDVVAQFSHIVTVAHNAQQFVEACEMQARQPDLAAIERGVDLAGHSSWDNIVEQLEQHVDDAIRAKEELCSDAA